MKARDLILAALRERPTATPLDLIKVTRLPRSTVYRVVKRLKAEGVINGQRSALAEEEVVPMHPSIYAACLTLLSGEKASRQAKQTVTSNPHFIATTKEQS